MARIYRDDILSLREARLCGKAVQDPITNLTRRVTYRFCIQTWERMAASSCLLSICL